MPIHGHEFDVLFGPRVTAPLGPLHPFGELMIGIAHMKSTFPSSSLSDTSFGAALGGGVDYTLLDVLAWRVEADYVHTSFFHSHQKNFRLSTGIVFRF
jgi:opacity protein-like surface antigen